MAHVHVLLREKEIWLIQILPFCVFYEWTFLEKNL